MTRDALLAILPALDAAPRALRRDECGDWRITGRYGWIYADSPSVRIYYRGADEHRDGTSKRWFYAKEALAFCAVAQDGDTEGVLWLDRAPTEAEGEIIRHKLKIPKRVEHSEETIARLRQQTTAMTERRLGRQSQTPPATLVPEPG